MTDEKVPSWGDIARTYGRFLYNVAYRLTGNDDDAQDLVQEVLLRVRKGLETYRPGSMEGWLSRITTNAFLDDVRCRRRRPAEPLPSDPDRVVPPHPSAEETLSRLALPDEVEAALRPRPAVARLYGFFGRRLAGRRRWRAGVATVSAAAAASLALAGRSVPNDPHVAPSVPRLVEAHAAAGAVRGDPMTQLVPAAT